MRTGYVPERSTLTPWGSATGGVDGMSTSSHGASLSDDATVSESVSALGSVSTSPKPKSSNSTYQALARAQ